MSPAAALRVATFGLPRRPAYPGTARLARPPACLPLLFGLPPCATLDRLLDCLLICLFACWIACLPQGRGGARRHPHLSRCVLRPPRLPLWPALHQPDLQNQHCGAGAPTEGHASKPCLPACLPACMHEQPQSFAASARTQPGWVTGSGRASSAVWATPVAPAFLPCASAVHAAARGRPTSLLAASPPACPATLLQLLPLPAPACPCCPCCRAVHRCLQGACLCGRQAEQLPPHRQRQRSRLYWWQGRPRAGPLRQVLGRHGWLRGGAAAGQAACGRAGWQGGQGQGL